MFGNNVGQLNPNISNNGSKRPPQKLLGQRKKKIIKEAKQRHLEDKISELKTPAVEETKETKKITHQDFIAQFSKQDASKPRVTK